MNKDNFATLETSKRLADAGIVLETDAVWNYWLPDKYILVYKKDATAAEENCIPAPCMAEVWRELPEDIRQEDDVFTVNLCRSRGVNHASYDGDFCLQTFGNEAPTDALIDLLIEVRKRAPETVGGKKWT